MLGNILTLGYTNNGNDFYYSSSSYKNPNPILHILLSSPRRSPRRSATRACDGMGVAKVLEGRRISSRPPFILHSHPRSSHRLRRVPRAPLVPLVPRVPRVSWCLSISIHSLAFYIRALKHHMITTLSSHTKCHWRDRSHGPYGSHGSRWCDGSHG